MYELWKQRGLNLLSLSQGSSSAVSVLNSSLPWRRTPGRIWICSPVKCVGSSDRCAHGRHAPPGRVTEPCPVGHSSSSEGQLPLFLYLWKNIKTCTCSKEAPSTVHSTWNLPSNSKEGSGSKEAHLSTQTWLPNLQQTSEWRLCMVSRMPRVMADTLPFCCHVQPHGNSFSLARGR